MPQKLINLRDLYGDTYCIRQQNGRLGAENQFIDAVTRGKVFAHSPQTLRLEIGEDKAQQVCRAIRELGYTLRRVVDDMHHCIFPLEKLAEMCSIIRPLSADKRCKQKKKRHVVPTVNRDGQRICICGHPIYSETATIHPSCSVQALSDRLGVQGRAAQREAARIAKIEKRRQKELAKIEREAAKAERERPRAEGQARRKAS